MFRKPFAVNQTHKVSGADRKKIRRSVQQSLGLPPDSPQLDALLPPKAGDLELAKLPAPSRTVIYLLDNTPVLLDTSGKGDFLPTVMGLWRCSHSQLSLCEGGGQGSEVAGAPLLPVVEVKHWQVSKFIVGGADLMLPGVNPASLPAEFPKGALMAVVVPGNPCPIAVGVAALNSQTAHAQAAGGKGKLVELLQYYGDALWAGLGGGATPNPGFQQGFVLPLNPAGGGVAAAAADTEDSDEEDEEGGEGASGCASAAAAAQAMQQQLHLGGSSNSQQQQQPRPANGTNGTSGGDDTHPSANSASSSATSPPPPSAVMTPQEMDALLESSLLQALFQSVGEADLPLSSAALWGSHITPCRPRGSTLDLKRSSHKKLSKLLQAYTKAGLISTREEKHSGDTLLTGFNPRHALLEDFVPHKAAGSGSGAGPAAAAGAGAGAGAAAAGGGGGQGLGGPDGVQPLLVEEVYKPSREVQGIFEAVGANPDAVYTAAAIGDVAFAYAKQQQLDVRSNDDKTLLLDPELCDALFKGVLKKGETFPTHIAKAELRAAFLARCSAQTRLTRGAHSVTRKGAPPAVCVSGERRQGNKYVTRVTGLEAFLVDPATLASQGQRLFACSTTLGPLPGKNNPGQEVILQGNVIDKVPDYLMRAYGIPKKFFLVKK